MPLVLAVYAQFYGGIYFEALLLERHFDLLWLLGALEYRLKNVASDVHNSGLKYPISPLLTLM